ncbi:hypothetical protein [Acidocella aromatica]|uniref:Uncharacterized protein n=1 Tax=Acidocella aromatica TaxID=1303579 RepID=A0A840VKG1_9PROT|nr:hypothetical protein [Acidocella aromatica]MBB5371990.1 hypothetical protein [Acidocella aromatica]
MKDPKMKRRNTAKTRGIRLSLLTSCFLGVTLASIIMPARSLAQGMNQADILPVADITLFPLANNTMASVKGTGLQGPSLNKSSTPLGTITLWDELKPSPQQQSIISGSQVITINGISQ